MDLNTIREVSLPKTRKALPEWRAGDAFLGGGTWLFSEPQPQLTRLIDLTTLGWQPLRASKQGLEIAATCTIAQLDAFAAPVEWIAAPLIGQCCRAFLASFKIWNTATVGGNICCSLPAGPMISLASALDGEALLWAPDGAQRRMPVAAFVTGVQSNALTPGEVVRSIHIAAAALTRRAAFRQISLSHHGRSGALLIGTLTPDGGFDLTVTASTPRPFKFRFDAMPAPGVLATRIDEEIGSHWYDDIHGLPAWRRHMTLLFARDILAELSGTSP